VASLVAFCVFAEEEPARTASLAASDASYAANAARVSAIASVTSSAARARPSAREHYIPISFFVVI